MELEQLRQLVAVKQYGTISAAAEALHISQPSLSRSIRRLERDLGQELFNRSHNSVSFNDAGELALRHAERILADVRLMQDDFDELGRRQRSLRVASVAPAPVWRLTALTVERYPGTILEPSLMSEQQVESLLINRGVDMAILLRPMALPTLRSIPLMTEDLFVSVPAGHRLAGRKTLSFADLNGESFLIMRDIGFWMDITRRQIPESRLVEQGDRSVFMQMARTTDMLCFTTDAPENTDSVDGRVTIPIVDADAHATYFLAVPTVAPDRAQEIASWVEKQVGPLESQEPQEPRGDKG